jgi:hypothetical protein
MVHAVRKTQAKEVFVFSGLAHQAILQRIWSYGMNDSSGWQTRKHTLCYAQALSSAHCFGGKLLLIPKVDAISTALANKLRRLANLVKILLKSHNKSSAGLSTILQMKSDTCQDLTRFLIRADSF